MLQFRKQEARSKLNKMIANLTLDNTSDGNSNIISAVVSVELPDADFVYKRAIGQAYPNSDKAMTIDHQFHVASVAKPMTATLILQLIEEGALGDKGLDATLLDIGVFDPDIVHRLHMMDGVSYGHLITIRHLLTHTSGLKDVLSEVGNDTQAESFLSQYLGGVDAHLKCLEDPDCDMTKLFTSKNWIMWNPDKPDDKEAGILNWFLTTGTSAASNSEPGKLYDYVDTGYLILGLVAEYLTGKSLHRLLRERIFDPLGMDKTYLTYANDPDPAPWIHADSDFLHGDLGILSSQFNLSYTWGAGGIVSTVDDLNCFIKNLMAGNLFQKQETLQDMTQIQYFDGIKPPRLGVGCGIVAEGVDPNTVFLGHSGSNGTKMFCEPELGLYIVGTMNQNIGVPYYWWHQVVHIMRDAGLSI